MIMTMVVMTKIFMMNEHCKRAVHDDDDGRMNKQKV